MSGRTAAVPILATKLYAPRARRAVVARPRLLERLEQGAGARLTLVSAPPGFGKSTLLGEWLAASPTGGRQAAWLSLDAGDNGASVFWTNVVAALQSVLPSLAEATRALLLAPEPASTEAVLATLINELSALPSELVLVLDDYHVIEAADIHDSMAFLLEHQPPRVHLVLATRADPPLPLARMRASGDLVEIRAADLRFTPDEAAAYLNDVMGLGVGDQDVAALETRTEGWIAALQLAALSMQGRDDASAFVAGFAGDDRYIVDYLVEEVLHRQPDAIRTFLLETSILSRLTGPLADAVTSRGGGRATLEALDRGNLFLVALDDSRRWYRYHHLFADVLQARLMDEQPELVPVLHRRASEWFAQDGERSEAIRHALAGADYARTADLLELELPALRANRREAELRRWLELLPHEELRVRPVLSNAYAGTLMQHGETQGVEKALSNAEHWLGGPRDGMVVADEDAFRTLPAAVALHRAGFAMLTGDLAATLSNARRALDLVDDDEHLVRGGAAGLLALAQWTLGDLDAASAGYTGAIASLLRVGHVSDAIGLTLAAADVRMAQGRLADALAVLDRGWRLATEPGGPPRRGAADMLVGIGQILFERNDLIAARDQLARATDLGEDAGLPQARYRSRVLAAQLRQAAGDIDSALELLAEAERLYFGDFSPNVRPVPAVRARLLIRAGRLAEAAAWVRDSGVSADDALTYVREFEHLTLARLLLAQANVDEALRLLDRLLHAALDGGRNASAIEILVVQAVAHRAGGRTPAALDSLERAIRLAEPEGHVRVFVEEGAALEELLRLAATRPAVPDTAGSLLAAVSGGSIGPDQSSLAEPLSDRELEVLRMLGSELSGPDIARELFVSLNTVRTHTKSIFAKLGVNSRRAAVRRATELGLLSSR